MLLVMGWNKTPVFVHSLLTGEYIYICISFLRTKQDCSEALRVSAISGDGSSPLLRQLVATRNSKKRALWN
jgi:hypothetical protein